MSTYDLATALLKLATPMSTGQNGTTPPSAAGPFKPPAPMAPPTADSAFRPPVPPASPRPAPPGPSNAPMTGAIKAKAPSKSSTAAAPSSSSGATAKSAATLNDMLAKPNVDIPSSKPIPAPPAPRAFKPGKPGVFKTFRPGSTSGTI